MKNENSYTWNHIRYKVNQSGKYNVLILFILECILYVTVVCSIGFCLYIMILRYVPLELGSTVVCFIVGLIVFPLTAFQIVFLITTILGSIMLSIWKYKVASIVVRYIPIEVTISILSGYSVNILNKNSYIFYERDYDIFRELVKDLKIQSEVYRELSAFILVCLSDRKLSYIDSLYISLVGDYIIKQSIFECRGTKL